MFDGVKRWVVKRELKKRGMSDSDASKLAKSLISNSPTGKGPQIDALPRGKDAETAPEYVPSTRSDDEGTGGDPVLDRYYDMLNKATEPKAIEAWGDKINERESFLLKSEQMRRVRQSGPRGQRSNENESLTSNLESLDITNLAPHADAISKELIQWVKQTGLLPAGLEATATSSLAGIIKSNPDIVKKGLDAFGSVLNKYAGKQGAQPKGSMTLGNFDPAHPELWAGSLGYGKQ